MVENVYPHTHKRMMLSLYFLVTRIIRKWIIDLYRRPESRKALSKYTGNAPGLKWTRGLR